MNELFGLAIHSEQLWFGHFRHQSEMCLAQKFPYFDLNSHVFQKLTPNLHAFQNLTPAMRILSFQVFSSFFFLFFPFSRTVCPYMFSFHQKGLSRLSLAHSAHTAMP